jgi:dTDP-glucose 4,6-dehydratase
MKKMNYYRWCRVYRVARGAPFCKKLPDYTIINLDKLTYAGNLANLKDIENEPNYRFVKGDIVDLEFISNLFETEQPDAVIHLAAESHVDRSITNPLEFVMTNVVGTVNLLNAAKTIWKGQLCEKPLLPCINRRGLRYPGRYRYVY